MSPADSIAYFAALNPNQTVARDLVSGRAWTYDEFDREINQVANYLLTLGCEPQARVVAIARNSVDLVILHLACSRAELVFAPLNWRLSAVEIAALIALAAPKVLVVDPASQALIDNKCDFLYLSSLIENSKNVQAVKHCPRDLNRPSLLLFTSGTTSLPKGVLLTEKNLMMCGVNFTMLTAVERSSCFLCEAPMFHVIGMVTNIRPVLQLGGSIAVSDGFKPDRTLRWLGDEALGISHYIGVPQMIEAFRQEPSFNPAALRKLTALITGGAPHKLPDILAWIADGVPVVSGFGMSEAGTVFGLPVDMDIIARKAGSVGITVPWLDVRVVDENGHDCAVNCAGELWLRGDSIMPQYYNNPEATAAAITADNWFKTGDIVRCDEDGYFWVLDRKKDMFISGGENIYPAELEAALTDYEAIKEAAVIGIPDDKWGEVGCVFAVPKDKDAFVEYELLEYLGAKLARYKIPKKVVTVEKLPRTSTGKLQKQLLRSAAGS